MRGMILGVALIAATECGGPASPAPSPAATATVMLASNAKLGQILVDGSGRTLYLFEKDTSSSSTCYGSCAAYWPPLLTGGAPHAGTGVNATLLGTTKRTDGTTEVTYAGHPLYYVVTDHNAGDATGQGVSNFGAAWYVVGPGGNKITG